MSLELIRSAIVTTLQGIASIGLVHPYERYAADLKALAALYTTEISGQRQLRGWYVQRAKTMEAQSAKRAFFDRHTWRVRGFMSLADADQSELVFDGLVEAARAAFRADLTLGGVVMAPEKDEHAGVAVESGPVLFAGVLCHSATLTLTTKSFVTLP